MHKNNRQLKVKVLHNNVALLANFISPCRTGKVTDFHFIEGCRFPPEQGYVQCGRAVRAIVNSICLMPTCNHGEADPRIVVHSVHALGARDRPSAYRRQRCCSHDDVILGNFHDKIVVLPLTEAFVYLSDTLVNCWHIDSDCFQNLERLTIVMYDSLLVWHDSSGRRGPFCTASLTELRGNLPPTQDALLQHARRGCRSISVVVMK